METAARLKDESVIGFLNHEMADGLELESRVAAAYGLRRRGKSEALAAMIREWHKLLDDPSRGEGASEPVIQFLASCDSVEAIAAIKSGFTWRPVSVRMRIIESLGAEGHWQSGRYETNQSPEMLVAIEQCLVEALGDIEEMEGFTGSDGRIDYSDPRIGDLAAWRLADRWPGRYKFDMTASSKSRDRQRVVLMNVWRQAHNLPPLPLPELPVTKVSLNQATKVTLIEWAADSLKAQPAYAARIAKLLNKPLRVDDLIRLLSDFARKPEPGATGLQIKAFKDSDLTGVQITVRLLPGSPPTASQNWEFRENIAVGNRNLASDDNIRSYDNPEDWDDEEEPITEAIAGAPEKPFKINLTLKTAK